MQIVNLTEMDMAYLAEAITRAQAEGRRFRIHAGSYTASNGTGVQVNFINYKVGEGSWSPPVYDDAENDPYRD